MTNVAIFAGSDGRFYLVENGKAIFMARDLDTVAEIEHGIWEQQADLAAEAANERWWEERGGSTYAGSEEEARDRFYDSLIGA